MAVCMAREIEYLPRQDARSEIHGVIVARSRFFTVILYTSYCIRIMESHPFANRRKRGVSVVRADGGQAESGKFAIW